MNFLKYMFWILLLGGLTVQMITPHAPFMLLDILYGIGLWVTFDCALTELLEA